MNIDTIILKINENIINPIIAFLFVLATVIFVFGLVQFFLMGRGSILGSTDKGIKGVTSIERGKRHIVWGLVGMFIMISVFAFMRLIVSTFDIELPPGTVI